MVFKLRRQMKDLTEEPKALYQQVKAHILKKIDSGEWLPDTKIPSENQLVKTLNVSRMTVNRAMRELSEDDRLVRIQGVGTYVARPKPIAALYEIRNIDEEIKEWGGIYSCTVILLAQEKVFPELAVAMKMPMGTKVFHSVIVHKSNGKPVMLGDRFVNPLFAPDYLKQDFTKITPSKYLMGIISPTDIEHIIEAGLPDEQTQQLLEITAQDPCLYLHRQTWSGEGVVTHSRMIYPGTTYRISGRFKTVFSYHEPSLGKA
ncbi:HutC [Desulforapulum autotrophicum HRM2]|uniref:Histidine utilization repressor n=2 Tax=Desulforapulum autotrophicum TaxID=2296 RepID=C0QEW5_DESAH|nr:HutC [Desulforapulum autotrophicum HRM2]